MTSLLGHDAQASTLIDAAASGRMHHGWILSGPKGIGKGSFARAMALRLLADAAGPPVVGSGLDVPESHPVRRLIEASAHPIMPNCSRWKRMASPPVQHPAPTGV